MQSLKFSLSKNEEVIGSKNAEAIARHEALLMSKLEAVHTVKESIVQRKFIEGESEEEVNTWTKEFDGFLGLNTKTAGGKDRRRKASGGRDGIR